MYWAILDTSVYIGHWEQGLYEETLEGVRRAYIVRHSAVVLSELHWGHERARPSLWLQPSIGLPECAASPRQRIGGKRDDWSERSGMRKAGTETSGEIFKTMRSLP
jgi:hypothetical protein